MILFVPFLLLPCMAVDTYDAYEVDPEDCTFKATVGVDLYEEHPQRVWFFPLVTTIPKKIGELRSGEEFHIFKIKPIAMWKGVHLWIYIESSQDSGWLNIGRLRYSPFFKQMEKCFQE